MSPSFARVLLTSVLFLVAACSTGSDEASDPTLDSTKTTSLSSAPGTMTPDAEVSVSTGSTILEDEATDEGGGLVINGPAQVVVDDETELVEGIDFTTIETLVGEQVDEAGVNGAGLVVVDGDDGVVFEGYWGDFDEARVSLIASSTKMISAGVLLHLDDQGLLDINAPISDYIEWGDGDPNITVAQLLSNSSGLVGLAPNPAYTPYLCQFTGEEVEQCGQEILSTPDDDGDTVQPDKEFRYGGGQWQVAGAVAESVSGKSWATLIDEIYIQPCGLETLGYNNHFATLTEVNEFGYPEGFGSDPDSLEPTQNPSIEGGGYTNVSDYAVLLEMHLNGGFCGDQQVLSQEALDAMHGDRIGDVYDGDADGPSTGYGMGWWVDRETGRISDPGLYGSTAWLDLENGYGVYLVVEANGTVGSEITSALELPIHGALTS